MMRYHEAENRQGSCGAKQQCKAAAGGARYPVNLLESELGQEVRELLSHQSLPLTSGHQAWLMMAILYLVERERLKVARKQEAPAELSLVLAEPA